MKTLVLLTMIGAMLMTGVAYSQTPTFESGSSLPQRRGPFDGPAVIGETFWLAPIPSAPRRVGFAKDVSLRPFVDDDKMLYPTSDVKFQVIELIPSSIATKFQQWYRVEFADGSSAFIRRSDFDGRISKLTPESITRSNLLVAKIDLPNDTSSYHIEHFFRMDPALLRTAMARAEADEAAVVEARRKEVIARQARGGVAAGMTRAQVLASSWGRPSSVNKTIRSNGNVHEQWVYGGANYLYFDNGVLTTIQTSE